MNIYISLDDNSSYRLQDNLKDDSRKLRLAALIRQILIENVQE